MDCLMVTLAIHFSLMAINPYHSTETALIKVWNHIHLETDLCKVSVLVVLNLIAGFDTSDYTILLDRLENFSLTLWHSPKVVHILSAGQELVGLDWPVCIRADEHEL